MIKSYIQLMTMVLFTSISQILIKKGSDKIRTGRGIYTLVKTFINPHIITGMFLVAIAPLLYFSALSRIPLNMAFSINGLGYIIVIVAGRFILKERISIFHIAGGLLILAGFVVWNQGFNLS